MVSLGAWSMLGSPASASVLAGIGADWLVLDAQHGLYEDRSLVDALALLRASGAASTTHVRVPAGEPWLIGRALDAGAAGVIVPMVQNPEAAAAVVAAARYAPTGTRSWGPFDALYGNTPPDAEAANRRVHVSVMVESASAIAQVEEIAAVPGVDMVFVGPYDLSIALGTTLPELVADTSPGNPLDAVVAACRRAGVTAGAFAGSRELALAFAERGFTSLAVAVDTMVLARAASDLIAETRSAID